MWTTLIYTKKMWPWRDVEQLHSRRCQLHAWTIFASDMWRTRRSHPWTHSLIIHNQSIRLKQNLFYCQMHFFGTKGKPPLYAGIAVVSLMILTGLAFAGTAVTLTVMMPVLVVLSPILVPAVITSSFLATGFLASGSLGASGIALLIWLYK